MANVYNKGKFILGSSAVPSGIVFRCMLMKSSFAYDKDDNFVSDISSNEITGANYARANLVSAAWVEDDTNDRAELRSDEVAFGSIVTGETVTDLVVYEQTGGNDSSPSNDGLICVIGLSDTPTNGQPFSVRFNGSASAGAVLRINDS